MMSKITTLQDLKTSDENKIKKTIATLNEQIKTLSINEFKNKRYIQALETQIRTLAVQLKEIKQEPKLDLTSILRDVNEDRMKSRGMSKKEIDEFDDYVNQKIKDLMV